VTLSKKSKGKKVANKSLASSVKRNAVGYIVSSPCVKVDLAVHKTVVSKYQEMCVRCAKEINTFLDLCC
jgi:hypothetical protein